LITENPVAIDAKGAVTLTPGRGKRLTDFSETGWPLSLSLHLKFRAAAATSDWLRSI
jgi:hypothetical protein